MYEQVFTIGTITQKTKTYNGMRVSVTLLMFSHTHSTLKSKMAALCHLVLLRDNRWRKTRNLILKNYISKWQFFLYFLHLFIVEFESSICAFYV